MSRIRLRHQNPRLLHAGRRNQFFHGHTDRGIDDVSRDNVRNGTWQIQGLLQLKVSADAKSLLPEDARTRLTHQDMTILRPHTLKSSTLRGRRVIKHAYRVSSVFELGADLFNRQLP